MRDDSGKENHGVFDDNLTASPNLFDYSEIGRNGTALDLMEIKQLPSSMIPEF